MCAPVNVPNATEFYPLQTVNFIQCEFHLKEKRRNLIHLHALSCRAQHLPSSPLFSCLCHVPSSLCTPSLSSARCWVPGYTKHPIIIAIKVGKLAIYHLREQVGLFLRPQCWFSGVSLALPSQELLLLCYDLIPFSPKLPPPSCFSFKI